MCVWITSYHQKLPWQRQIMIGNAILMTMPDSISGCLFLSWGRHTVRYASQAMLHFTEMENQKTVSNLKQWKKNIQVHTLNLISYQHFSVQSYNFFFNNIAFLVWLSCNHFLRFPLCVILPFQYTAVLLDSLPILVVLFPFVTRIPRQFSKGV